MTDEHMNDIESQIDELLNQGLDEQDRLDVLRLIAGDDRYAAALREQLTIQEQSRAAYGYGNVNEVIDKGRKQLDEIMANRNQSSHNSIEPRRWLPRFRTSLLVRVAAMVVIGVSIYVGTMTYRASQVIDNRLANSVQPAAMLQVTEAELAGFTKIWREILDPTQESRPWVLLNNGGGQFGYVPTARTGAAHEQLVLVRCLLVDSSGRNVSKVSILVPQRQETALSVPEAALAGNLPVRCTVWFAGDRGGVRLTSGEGKSQASGI